MKRIARDVGNFSHAISGKGLIAVVLWGASFVFTRKALASFNPFGLISLRLIAGTALLVVVLKLFRKPLLPERSDRPVCVVLGGVMGLHLLMQAYGLQHTSAMNTGWIIGFIPVTIAVGSHFLGKQRVTALGWTGVLIGTVGILLVMWKAPPDFSRARLGDSLQVLSCLTWTIYTLVGVAPTARSGPLSVTTFCMGVAAVMVTLMTVRTGFVHETPTFDALASLAFLGFLCGGIAYYLWFRAVAEQGPVRTGSLLYIEPFVTVAVATTLLRETVTDNAVLGGVCVLGGVWMIARGSQKVGVQRMERDKLGR